MQNQELWETILRYLSKCNKGWDTDNDFDLHELVVLSKPDGVIYKVVAKGETKIESNDLEEVGCFLKVYTSWEED